jgi:hypothetical protein
MSHYPINRVERVRDLRRVLTDRHGRTLPNDATGRVLLSIVLDHAALIEGDLAERMAVQLLPEASDAEIAFMIHRAGAGRMWGPTELAKALNLTEATRVRLQVKTILAVDVTPTQRRTRRKVAQRQRRDARLAAEAADGNPSLHINADA